MYEDYQVLFVDDEEDILRSLRRGLIDEGYSCHFALSGEKALEIMENNPISVIVSDMKMPGMDGLRLLNEVRERWPKTIRIVLSGYMKLPQIILSINQAGIFRFIQKPWRLEEEFIIAIREALDFYIEAEEKEKYIERLAAKKELYLSFLHKNVQQTRQYKKNVAFFAELGRAIVSFQDQDEDKARRNNIRDAGREMLSLFSNTIITRSEEFQSFHLTERCSRFLMSRFQEATITKLTDRDIIVTTFYKVIEAIIEATILIFYNELTTYGVASRIGVQEDDKFCIYLVTSFNDADMEVQNQIDEKLEFFSKVLGDFSIYNVSCVAKKHNARIVVAIVVGQVE